MKIALDKISPDPKQPRKDFDPAELETLAASIQANGLMQAITLRPRGADTFWIVAGERRYRAHCLLRDRCDKRFASIEVVIKRPPSIVDLRVRQVVENIARVDLKPLEEARSYADLLTLGLTDEEAAARLGVPVSRVRTRLSLLNLDPVLITLLEGNQLDKQQAYDLARLHRHEDQTRLLQMINRGEIGQWKSLKRAVDALLEGVTQTDMFGAAAPVASSEDLATVSAMERKIETVSHMIAAGWRNGECIVATKVSPDRAALMADKLASIRAAVRHMEQELRNITAQARIALAA